MNDLPHGLTPEDLREELEKLDSNIQVGPDITWDEYVELVRYLIRRRRRGAGATTSLPSSIVITPSVLSVPTGAPIGTVVGTLSVANGFGTYTYSLTYNPGNYFIISGNQIQVGATLPPPQVVPIQIQGNNSLGDRPTLSTTITITVSAYVPTYYLYGF